MQKGASEKKLKAGEIVPIDIELYPGSTFLPAETLQLIIASDEIIPSPPWKKSLSAYHGSQVKSESDCLQPLFN